MNTGALIMMILSVGIVTAVTIYFFWLVLRQGPPNHVDEHDADYPRGG